MQVMSVLRENRDSVMAMLEAFVYDPLISWRLLTNADAAGGGGGGGETAIASGNIHSRAMKDEEDEGATSRSSVDQLREKMAAAAAGASPLGGGAGAGGAQSLTNNNRNQSMRDLKKQGTLAPLHTISQENGEPLQENLNTRLLLHSHC